MLTLLFMVIFSATFILFSDETTAFVKKWYAVYWCRVFVPLLVISWVWVWNDEIIPLLLAWSKEHIELMIIALSEPLPQSIQWIANAAGLFFLVSLPVWLLHLRLSRTVMTKAQANLVSHIYFFLWLFFSLIILV